MKNIIIGGVVRSGKSTLASRIVKTFGYSLFESDSVVHAFNEVFPELGIVHNRPEQARENYKQFLHVLLHCNLKSLKHNDIVTVFPGAQFLPKHLADLKDLDKHIVIFLGMDSCTPEELAREIRAHDSEKDWTHQESDERLLKHAEKIISESKSIKAQCAEYGFFYFDTAFERESVFESILRTIEEEQKA